MKKIMAIGIISMFLLTGMAAVSAFNLEETSTKSNQSFKIYLTDYNPVVNLNDDVSFEVSVSDSDGKPVSFCNYEVYTIPSEEDVSCQRIGDKIVGEFTATRTGMYSLIVDIADLDNNAEKNIFYYFVGSSGTEKVRYYFRDDLPTHDQPIGNGHDSGSLLLEPPTQEEIRWCGSFIQFSPDELPTKNPISILTDIYIHCLFRFKLGIVGKIGIQKDLGAQMDESKPLLNLRSLLLKSILNMTVYRWATKDFRISWQMDDVNDWYNLQLKLYGNGPILFTNPEEPSYADFTYTYCNTPNIKSISNTNIVVLSATSEVDNSNNAEIILEGTGTTNLVIQMPDNSKTYSATFNGVECDFTQVNGELTFNLQLDSEHAEHSLDICSVENSKI